MTQNKLEDKNLSEFLAHAGNSPDHSLPLPRSIEKDLVVSRTRLCVIYFLGSVLGYMASLAICAQYGVGFSALSWKLAEYIHSIPDPWCPILCGFVFGISPTLVSVVYFSRFQHRFLIFRMGWLPASVPVLGTLTLVLLGDSRSWEWRGIWFLSAMATPYLIEVGSALILRQRQWTKTSS